MLVEMHAHVIYGVDDGPRTPEEMQYLLQEAAHGGVRHLFCTSHAKGIFPLDMYREHFSEAEDFVREKGLKIALHPGSEIFYTPAVASQLLSGTFLPLGDSRLILLEFDPMVKADEAMTAVKNLCGEGWQIALAHAERCDRLCRGDTLARLREEYGVLVQMNAVSVYEERSGFFFRRRVLRLLKEGVVDLVSSDAHDLYRRAFCLNYAHHWLRGHYSQDVADALCGGNIAVKLGLTEE